MTRTEWQAELAKCKEAYTSETKLKEQYNNVIVKMKEMNKPEGENMVYIFIFIELSCSTHWSFPQLMLCDGILQGCLQRFIMAHFLLPNSHTTPPQLVYKSIFNSSSREMCTPNHLTVSLQHKSIFVHTTNNTAGRHGKTSYIYTPCHLSMSSLYVDWFHSSSNSSSSSTYTGASCCLLRFWRSAFSFALRLSGSIGRASILCGKRWWMV